MAFDRQKHLFYFSFSRGQPVDADPAQVRPRDEVARGHHGEPATVGAPQGLPRVLCHSI